MDGAVVITSLRNMRAFFRGRGVLSLLSRVSFKGSSFFVIILGLR